MDKARQIMAWAAAGTVALGVPAMAKPDKAELTTQAIDARIIAHRTADVTLTVMDAAGKPLAGAKVTVRQTRHKFLFGCNAYMLGRCGKPALERAYRRRFAALLNYATLPFYWGAYERRQGQPAEARVKQMARWCAKQGIRAKGHPLCWHEVTPKWLRAKTAAEVRTAQAGRITREVEAFAGLIDTWDVVNEAVVMPRSESGRNPVARLCKTLGRAGLIGETFGLARRANPRATLILNDFDTTAAYAKLIRQCLDVGVPIDAIGIQSHMHVGAWGSPKTWEVCERFAAFGRPLHFTEATLLSGKLKTDNDWHKTRPNWNTTAGGEKRQAREVREFYRVLFSHPAVEAITWWDLADLGAWQGAPAGLVRKDMSPKPAYEALMQLIKKDWWTGPLTLTADAAGRVRFRGFLGSYAVRTARGGAAFELRSSGRRRVTARVGRK